MKNQRTFDNKKYDLERVYTDKKDVERKKGVEHKKGYTVRTIKGKKNGKNVYYVYVSCLKTK